MPVAGTLCGCSTKAVSWSSKPVMRVRILVARSSFFPTVQIGNGARLLILTFQVRNLSGEPYGCRSMVGPLPPNQQIGVQSLAPMPDCIRSQTAEGFRCKRNDRGFNSLRVLQVWPKPKEWRRWVVDPAIVGETPTGHPICRVSTAVVQGFCKPKVGGLNPSPGTTPFQATGIVRLSLMTLTRRRPTAKAEATCDTCHNVLRDDAKSGVTAGREPAPIWAVHSAARMLRSERKHGGSNPSPPANNGGGFGSRLAFEAGLQGSTP